MAYDALLFLHMVGLAMAVGTGFAMWMLGKASAGLDDDARTAFMLRTFAVSKVGSVGLLLLIITGITMLVMRFEGLMAMGGGALHGKFTLVAIQIGLLGFLQVSMAKAKRAGGGPLMARISKVGVAMLVNGLLIVLAAVLAFH